MRVWDRVDPARLCLGHLAREHADIHAIWAALRRESRREGRVSDPEALRWVGRRWFLRLRHEAVVAELERRGIPHGSELAGHRGADVNGPPPPLDDQEAALAAESLGCGCRHAR